MRLSSSCMRYCTFSPPAFLCAQWWMVLLLLFVVVACLPALYVCHHRNRKKASFEVYPRTDTLFSITFVLCYGMYVIPSGFPKCFFFFFSKLYFVNPQVRAHIWTAGANSCWAPAWVSWDNESTLRWLSHCKDL